MPRTLIWIYTCLLCALVAACSVPEEVKTPDVAGLSTTLAALGPDVSNDEAQRVAAIAYSYSQQLAVEYNVTDSALIHNAKVNQGLRPRGLCWHWAHDLEARLTAENLQSLQIHRAIANAYNLRIEHSTVILSSKGAAMEDGVVLDPWRYGGNLFWAPVELDTRYEWVPRQKVFDDKAARENRS